MMTDHCAKEKKDVHMLEELKKSAVLQQLGEQKILDSDNQELVPKFYANIMRLFQTLVELAYGMPCLWKHSVLIWQKCLKI
jgi:hypothetical protein